MKIQSFKKSCFLVVVTALLVAGCAGRPLAAEREASPELPPAVVMRVAPILKEVRAAVRDSPIALGKIECKEIKSKLLTTYLPEYRLFGINHPVGLVTRLIVLNEKNRVTDLGPGQWILHDTRPYSYLPKINEFLATRQIQVTNKEDALAVAQLVEGIQSLRGVGTFVGNRHWKYHVKQSGDHWRSSVAYVGPPASIGGPPTYEIRLDDDRRFREIRSLHSGPFPAR